MAIIYLITNKITGKQYVGQTIASLQKRISNHRYAAIHSHSHLPLYQDFSKYDKNNFDIQVLEQCDDSIRYDREKYWIERLDTVNSGYNICLGGIGQTRFSTKEIAALWNNGYTAKQIAEICKCAIGTVYDHLHLSNIQTADLRKRYAETIQNKKVGAYVQDGTILQEYKSIREAAIALITTGIAAHSDDLEKDISVIRRNIFSCLTGDRDIAYGLKWTYL